MKDILKYALVVVMACAPCLRADAQAVSYKVVRDKKAAEIVGKNSVSAVANEAVYTQELDSIRKERTRLLSKTAVRNMVKQARWAQQTYLGDLGQQKAAYTLLVKKCERFLLSSETLLTEAAKHPGRLLYCTKTVTRFTLDASDMVHRCIKIAMGGRLENPFKRRNGSGRSTGSSSRNSAGSGSSTGNASDSESDDGYNLVYPDERLMLVYETISHISKLNYAMDVLTFQLMTKWTWTDLLQQADPEGYYRLMAIVYEVNDIENDIRRLSWW